MNKSFLQSYFALVLCATIGSVLVGCGGLGQSEAFVSPGGQTSTNAILENGDGSNRANMVPPNVLSIPGIPIPDGVMVSMDDTVIVGADEVWSGQVVMTSENYQPIQMVQFMRTNMPRYGWLETAIVRSRRTSITFMQAGRFATVRIQPLDDNQGSEIDVIVSPSGQAQALEDRNQPETSPLRPVLIDEADENNSNDSGDSSGS